MARTRLHSGCTTLTTINKEGLLSFSELNEDSSEQGTWKLKVANFNIETDQLMSSCIIKEDEQEVFLGAYISCRNNEDTVMWVYQNLTAITESQAATEVEKFAPEDLVK